MTWLDGNLNRWANSTMCYINPAVLSLVANNTLKKYNSKNKMMKWKMLIYELEVGRQKTVLFLLRQFLYVHENTCSSEEFWKMNYDGHEGKEPSMLPSSLTSISMLH
jgi:hypothetical protein